MQHHKKISYIDASDSENRHYTADDEYVDTKMIDRLRKRGARLKLKEQIPKSIPTDKEGVELGGDLPPTLLDAKEIHHFLFFLFRGVVFSHGNSC